MKYIIIIFLMFAGTEKFFGQNKILDYHQLSDKEYLSDLEKNEELEGFVLSTGDTVKVGDLVIFGHPNKNRPTHNSLVNRKINYYTTIFQGDLNPKSILKFQYFPEGYEQEKAIVKKIIAGKIRKKNPGIIMFSLELQNPRVSHLELFGLPQSFETSELLVIDGKLTKEQALEQLKEAKQNLDLELITQSEYNEIKKKLAPIIMD